MYIKTREQNTIYPWLSLLSQINPCNFWLTKILIAKKATQAFNISKEEHAFKL